MKTQDNKIIKGLLIGLAVLIAIPFCFGIYASFTSHTGTIGEVLTALENECDCEELRINHSAFGIQYSKTDGVTSDQVAYLLKNCSFESTTQEFINKFNKQQLATIDDYGDLDFIEYQIQNGDEKQVITIRNGAIQ